MLNQVVLVGRIITIENNNVMINVPRNYKNEEGIYENDIFKINVIDNIFKNVKEYCMKGDLIGIRGRIESQENTIIIKAEKITFLNTRKEKEEN